jgi:hypothetical protein
VLLRKWRVGGERGEWRVFVTRLGDAKTRVSCKFENQT